ncbi:SDR family [Fusarium pseudocircinatum]|uniref:SDR family n=1 Tax=Fusarium pseudocircinatum TaxID=56676 RepID=A0A8H5PFM5_9HYPO|nr:SDR family [Fusarium pseudocircinatum]
MGKVVVAGGSSGLGRTMVDALEAAKTHDYIVLSRKATGPETRAVDYSDVDALTSLLESEQVDAVISMLPIDSDESGQAQLNLIEAAESNIAHVPSYQWKFKAVDALEKTNLEFSLVSIGLFLDYWAAPRMPTHIRAANIIIDPENNAAVIPGDGNTPVVLTHSIDAAKYAVALLDIPNWKRRYAIVTNRMTLNEAVKLAEEVKGVKFDVKYFSVEQMKSGENDLTPSMKKALPEEMHGGMKTILALSGIGMATGSNDIRGIDDLAVEFPDIKPVTIRDVWEAWK